MAGASQAQNVSCGSAGQTLRSSQIPAASALMSLQVFGAPAMSKSFLHLLCFSISWWNSHTGDGGRASPGVDPELLSEK